MGLQKFDKIGNTPRDVFNWWMRYDVLPGQYDLFEDYDEEEELWLD